MNRTIILAIALLLVLAAVVPAQPAGDRSPVIAGVQFGYSVYPASFELRNPWMLGLRIRWNALAWMGVQAEAMVGPSENAGGAEVMVADYGAAFVPDLPFSLGRIQPYGLVAGGAVSYGGPGAMTTGSVSAGVGLRWDANTQDGGGVTLEARDQLQFNAYGSGLTNVVRIILGAHRN